MTDVVTVPVQDTAITVIDDDITLVVSQARGAQGPIGETGLQGIQGEVGETGNAFNLRGSVPTAIDLPETDNEAADAYVTLDDGHLHSWNGSAWIDGGNVRGPQGIQGIQGEVGETGNAFALRGTVPTSADLPDSNNEAGDAYVTVDDGHLYAWSGDAWVDGGQIRGPQGIQGEVGPALNFRGSVPNVGDLPADNNEPGDAFTTNDSHMHVWTVGDAWLDIGSLQGPAGADGEPGRPFTLQGTVPTAADLPAAGNEIADAYVTLDDGHLHSWNGDAWIDGGNVRGPQGIQGEVGPSGSPTPAGADMQVQFNDDGTLGGDAEFLWDKTNNFLTLGSDTTPATVRAPQVVGNANGTNLTIAGGRGGATGGRGGTLILNGGQPVDGDGGNVSIVASGAATTTAQARTGGSISIGAGNGVLAGWGGDFQVNAGGGGANGGGGRILLYGGAGGATSGGVGGDITLTAGLGRTGGRGGQVTISARNSTGAGQNGGSVILVPGSSPDANGIAGCIDMQGWQADSYFDYQVPVTGFAFTIAKLRGMTIFDPAGTLATGTITMPAKPNPGQIVRFSTTAAITALTVAANTGQSIKNPPTSAAAGDAFAFIYRSTNTTWYRYP